MADTSTLQPVGVFEVIEEPVSEIAFSVGEESPLDVSVVEEDESGLVPGSDAVVEQNAQDPVKDTSGPEAWVKDGNHAYFCDYVKDQMKKVPRHTGNTTAGCRRALSFVRKLLKDIDKAMETDMESLVDELEISKLQEQLEEMEDRLLSRLKELESKRANANEEVRIVSSGACSKCGSNAPLWDDVENDSRVCLACGHNPDSDKLVKEASTPVLNVYITPFERAIVATIINSTVSAGNNIEETYALLKGKYNFSPREDLSFRQLLHDYGYPVIMDRARINENADPADGNGVDLATNYHA